MIHQQQKYKYTLRDSYDFYKDNTETPVDKKIYFEILYKFMEYLNELIVSGYKLILPNIGDMFMAGKKIIPRFDEDGNVKNLAINWKETNKLWEENEEAKQNKKFVYYVNEHTNLVRYKLLWKKENAKFLNKTLYSFVLTKVNKRRLAKLITSGKEYTNNDY